MWLTRWEELKEKGFLIFESKYWSRTGRVLNTEVTVNYLRYEGSEYGCAIMRDIEPRKRADVALRASEERYRALYEDTPTMYFTLATDGRVLLRQPFRGRAARISGGGINRALRAGPFSR